MVSIPSFDSLIAESVVSVIFTYQSQFPVHLIMTETSVNGCYNCFSFLKMSTGLVLHSRRDTLKWVAPDYRFDRRQIDTRNGRSTDPLDARRPCTADG